MAQDIPSFLKVRCFASHLSKPPQDEDDLEAHLFWKLQASFRMEVRVEQLFIFHSNTDLYIALYFAFKYWSYLNYLSSSEVGVSYTLEYLCSKIYGREEKKGLKLIQTLLFFSLNYFPLKLTLVFASPGPSPLNRPHISNIYIPRLYYLLTIRHRRRRTIKHQF